MAAATSHSLAHLEVRCHCGRSQSHTTWVGTESRGDTLQATAVGLAHQPPAPHCTPAPPHCTHQAADCRLAHTHLIGQKGPEEVEPNVHPDGHLLWEWDANGGFVLLPTPHTRHRRVRRRQPARFPCLACLPATLPSCLLPSQPLTCWWSCSCGVGCPECSQRASCRRHCHDSP